MVISGVAWAVEPAQRVGAFTLGMGVNEALAIVQKMGSLEGADFNFDEQRLFDTDLSLRMPSLGLQLCFDGFQQDLRVVSVCLRQQPPGAGGAADGEDPEEAADPVLLQLPPLVYNGRVFAGAGQPALALRDVYTMFGPTWIGDFRAATPSSGEGAAYFLRYPGLTFEFPLPDEMVESLAARGEHPMDLPGLPPPTAVRMWVFAQDSPSFEAPASAVPDMPEAVVVHPAVGVEVRGRMLRFGSMPQDVFTDFGPPESVCVKDVDAVQIHSARTMPSRFAGLDYYYNYFHMGLDVLFDGRTHLVKKVILHTNPPTHELFSQYSRCFFQVPLELDEPLRVSLAPPSARQPEPPPPPPLRRPAAAAAAAATGSGAAAAAAAAVGAGQGGSGDGQAPAPTAGSKESQPAVAASDSGGQAADAGRACGSSEAPRDEAAPDAASADPADDAAADAAGGDEGADSPEDARSTGRRMSKKERKAQKKSRKAGARAPLGSPLSSPGASPDLSAFSASPEPSPLLMTLCETEVMPSAIDDHCMSGLDGEPPPFDVLPPPAVPLDSLDLDEAALAAEEEGRQLSDAGGSGIGELGPGLMEAEAGEDTVLLDGDDLCIDVRWPWDAIQEVLSRSTGCSCGKPLIMSQTGHTPFGSTYFYAFPGLAFEVMQNGFLASLTVFNVPAEELPAVFLKRLQPQARGGGSGAAGFTAGAAA